METRNPRDFEALFSALQAGQDIEITSRSFGYDRTERLQVTGLHQSPKVLSAGFYRDIALSDGTFLLPDDGMLGPQVGRWTRTVTGSPLPAIVGIRA